MDFDTRSKIRPELNMTPLIDVVFLLIIFLMLTNGGLQLETITLDLPNSNSAEKLQDTPVVVALNQEGNYFLGKEAIEPNQLEIELKKIISENKEQTVLLNVAKDLTSQEMITAMDLIRNSGAKDLSIGTIE